MVTRALKGPKPNAAFVARYVGGVAHPDRASDEQSRLEYWGLPTAEVRGVSRADLGITHLSEDKQWALWLGVWKRTAVFDVKSAALAWMCHPKRRALRERKWKDLVRMVDQVDNWAHSDTLSSVLAEGLERDPGRLSQYKKWNRSKNPWHRRQSIVGLYCYARMREKHLPAKRALALVRPLLEDPHFYVQRGVGWTLREIDRVDRDLQRKFVRENLHRISGVAWFAASELYGEALRKKLVLQRRKQRGQR